MRNMRERGVNRDGAIQCVSVCFRRRLYLYGARLCRSRLARGRPCNPRRPVTAVIFDPSRARSQYRSRLSFQNVRVLSVRAATMATTGR